MPLLNIHDDALTVMETLQSGGISIVQLDVAYLICANRAAAIERIFAAKGRSADKPNGMLGNWDIFEQLLITDKRQRDIVRAVTVDFDIPLSVVAPFRPDAPILSSLEPESVARST
ncbi:MAG: hypothetical protein K0U93_29545, partial [Gammaproteobacteria bacterium]|nr:hypothetical protein [Gammaproteobacteria bacterium]